MVDQDACINCGLCVTNVPEVFRFAEHGKAGVYDPEHRLSHLGNKMKRWHDTWRPVCT